MTIDTLQARWQARTIPTDGSHLMWQGTPWLRFHGVLHRPARVAFTLRTGRQPVGPVWADCGLTGCIAPAHVEDRPGRQRARQQLRAVRGLPARSAVCAHGHDQTIHGRLDEDGRAYCNPCAGHQAAPINQSRSTAMTHIQDALFSDDAVTGTGQPTPWPLPVIRPLTDQDTDEPDPNQEPLPFGDTQPTADAA